MMISIETLKSFEKEVAEAFNAGKIRAPIHLSGGNEDKVIQAFVRHSIGDDDWVATQWRSHYHCLLKGVPPEQLMADILAGRSITLNYPEYKIISSAIVAGVMPIALGIALSLKRSGAPGRVFVFIGDMTALTGIARECMQYATGHDLPMHIVVEKNDLSVCTPVKDAWGQFMGKRNSVEVYEYKLEWPHAGAGVRVQF
jgi:pyruvate dehydrogenase E1 component alpha subunit